LQTLDPTPTELQTSSFIAFFYPGYASFKTLSQRPASEEDLERWLMYWSVLGFIVGIEYFAEWSISWYVTAYSMPCVIVAAPSWHFNVLNHSRINEISHRYVSLLIIPTGFHYTGQ
jgi:hypothetical protein